MSVCLVLQLPLGLLLERDKRAKWNGIPTLLQKLYESSHLNSDLSHAHSFLKVRRFATDRGRLQPLRLLWKLSEKLFPLVFLHFCPVAIVPALHGGHVFCHGGQEDRSGIHLPKHAHL